MQLRGSFGSYKRQHTCGAQQHPSESSKEAPSCYHFLHLANYCNTENMDSSNANRNDRIYARSFKDEGKGHAMYRNISTERMRPGTCGYFDHTGYWVKVFQVAEFEDPVDSTPQGVESMVAPLAGAINWMLGWSAAQKEEGNTSETAEAVPAQHDAVQNAAAPNIEPLAVDRVELDTQKDSEEWGMKASRQVNLKNLEAAANIA